MDVLGETHTLYVDDKGVLTVASNPTVATTVPEQLSLDINTTAIADIKDPGTAAVAETKPAVTAAADLATKASGGDADANTALPAKQEAAASSLKRTWQWARVAKSPAVTSGSLEDPLKHPYYETFKERVKDLKAASQISVVDPGQFAEWIWVALCKAVKAAEPKMADPKSYSDFAKGWLNMESKGFKKAIHEFSAIGKELAKASSAQFKAANKFGFWSKDEGRTLSESMNDLTLETSGVGSLMDGLPTLDGKKAGWDPEIWGALSKAYAEAMVPELVDNAGKKVNVCVGAGVPAGNIWETVESKALEKGLLKAGKTLEGVTTYWGAAAGSRGNRKKLDLTKNNGFPGAVFKGDRAGAISAADAHFNALPAEQLELPLKQPEPQQLGLPGVPPPAPGAAAPAATPPAGAPPAATPAATPAPTPAPTPAATPAVGAQPAGAQPAGAQPAGAQPAGAQPPALKPGEQAPLPLPAPPKEEKPPPVGMITIQERRKNAQAKIPSYVTVDDDYWFDTVHGNYPRRDGKRVETKFDKQVKTYWVVVGELGLTGHSKLNTPDFTRFQPDSANSIFKDGAPFYEVTDGDAEKFRHALVEACIDKSGFGASRATLDENVIQRNVFAKTGHNGIPGEIFNRWCAENVAGMTKSKWKWVIKKEGKKPRRIESDGALEGTDTFVETKAHVVDKSLSVTPSNVGVDQKQMNDYEAVLGLSKKIDGEDGEKMDCYDETVGQRAYYVDDNDVRHETMFTKVKYYLNNETVAAAYEMALKKRSGMAGKYLLDPVPKPITPVAAGSPPATPPALAPQDPPGTTGAPPLKQPSSQPAPSAAIPSTVGQPMGTVSPQAQAPNALPPQGTAPGADPAKALYPAPTPGAAPAAQPPTAQPPGAQPTPAPPANAQPDPNAQKGPEPSPPDNPIDVAGTPHTVKYNPATKKWEACSTPTPITSKLAELEKKLEKLPATDPDRLSATTEIGLAQGMEGKLEVLAQKVRDGDPAAPAQLAAQQTALATSVSKIWNIAEPAPMDKKRAGEVVAKADPECKDISGELAKDWVNKQRADFESQYIDKNVLRRAIIDKHLGPPPSSKSKMNAVASPDPIAVQKLADVDNELHLVNPGLKDTFYTNLAGEMGKA
ncbi:MAG TPA: hypothetical protein VEC14_06640, partial [Reyranellaceae bacterium]|nr:hypothetical protein [Reyranellaceae bacterium]